MYLILWCYVFGRFIFVFFPKMKEIFFVLNFRRKIFLCVLRVVVYINLCFTGKKDFFISNKYICSTIILHIVYILYKCNLVFNHSFIHHNPEKMFEEMSLDLFFDQSHLSSDLPGILTSLLFLLFVK